MLHRSRFCVALAAAAALLLAARAAHAQTISPTGQPTPDRIVNGQDLGASERPQNLTPLGVNYYDCTRDMSLRFNLALTGFTGQNVQVWATRSSMCTDPLARGNGASAATCWQVNGGLTSVLSTALSTHTFDIRVQDLVGPQAAPPYPPNPVHEGPAACQAQQGFAAVALTIWFIAVDSGNNLVGNAYSYPVSTDLVGPPAPQGVSRSAGDTLLQLYWTANVDTDTAGYDIYIDPRPGAAPTVTEASTGVQEAASQVVTVCPDASSSAPVDAGGDGSSDASGDDGSSDGASAPDVAAAVADASASDALPAGCYTTVVPVQPASMLGAGVSPSCADGGGSALLAQGFLSEGGSTETVADDSGVEGGTTTITTSGGGISQIPAANLINANGSTSITVSDKAVGAYTITGLTNDVTYSAVVAAVDGYGNIGPPSVEQCDFPAPVNDFFKTYRLAGGRAGGGFCTLEAVGEPVDVTVLAVPVAALVFGFARRRKRRAS